jgi:hypothetical protein
VKYIFIRKQKVVLCAKLRENQRESAASALTTYTFDHKIESI